MANGEGVVHDTGKPISPNKKQKIEDEYAICAESIDCCNDMNALKIVSKGLIKNKIQAKIVAEEELKVVNTNITVLNMEKEVWKEKFYELKLPGVVKAEISKYTEFKPASFEFQEYYLSQKVSDVEKEEEKIRQIWENLLLKSNHDFVVGFRKMFFIFWLDSNDYSLIASCPTARKKCHQITEILKDFIFEEAEKFPDYVVVHQKLNYLFRHEAIQQIEPNLEVAFLVGPSANETWLKDMFQKVAVRIANIYRLIDEKIRSAMFEPGEEIPMEYKILSDTRYKSFIRALMAYHVD